MRFVSPFFFFLGSFVGSRGSVRFGGWGFRFGGGFGGDSVRTAVVCGRNLRCDDARALLFVLLGICFVTDRSMHVPRGHKCVQRGTMFGSRFLCFVSRLSSSGNFLQSL